MVNIKGLHFSYGQKTVFSGLSLELQPGFIYGLLGRNGTGKSTLLRSIAGLLFPRKGSITVGGEIPGKRNPSFLSNVFMVPEEFYVPDVYTGHLVRHQAPFYPKFSLELFNQYLQEFQVPVQQSLQKMSYGQRKKALISFCLATQAALILMDEPTNGLDIVSKSQFRKVIAGALDENRTILISTHQVKDLESLIDRVTVIDDGRILFDQTMEEISNRISFKMSYHAEEVKQALYSERSLRGDAIVCANTEGEESRVDLELLYKAIVFNAQNVQQLFTHKN